MKLTEKELNEFPIGTKIYCGKEAIIKADYDKCNWRNMEEREWIYGGDLKAYEVDKIEIPTYTEYIPPKPILDEKEKEYLSYVIRPFKSKVKYIIKEKLYCNNSKSKEYIAISCFNSIDSFEMPLFKSNTMYKGMKLDKEYSLEELRIMRWKYE